VRYYIATCKATGEIAAAGCGVLRTLTTYEGRPIKAWYICDLKVGRKFRNQHLPLKLIRNAGWGIFQAPRGFGICMNPPQGEPKAAKLWRNHGPIAGSSSHTLNLYTLTGEEVVRHRDKIEATLRNAGYMPQDQHLVFETTDGIKDYQIFGDDPGKTHPWKLAHAQPGPKTPFIPEAGKTYMLSAVAGTPLDSMFCTLFGKAPASTAEIVRYGMKNVDFNQITSNQI